MSWLWFCCVLGVFFVCFMPWLSYEKSKQTELKIHSEGCKRVSLLSFTEKSDWTEKIKHLRTSFSWYV